MKNFMRSTVRPVALTMTAPVAGFLLIVLLEIVLKLDTPMLYASFVNLIIVVLLAFWVFPGLLGIPFGKIETREFLYKIGFHFPSGGWKHLVLGLVLAGCTLSGMLIASILTGRYVLDMRNIEISQLVFSLNPAFWEEIFYRGVLMLLLLQLTKSFKKAFVIQILLFGAMHIKGFDFLSLFDVLSVMVIAVGFTYIAHKTQLLVAGIVFHYFHDALLYFVQVPFGVYTGVTENILFYGLLWLMVGVACLVTKLAADRWGVRADPELYRVET